MARRTNVIPFLLASATGALTVAAAIQYRRQKQAALRELAANSALVDTRLGPIEAAIAGQGEPVVVLHGALGGYQQGLLAGEPLVDAGYQVIAPSRFGYLRSPLAEDSSPSAQADRIAALLDVLNIKQATVLGLSAGGPSAVEFAIRHADRTRALIMLCAVSQPRDVYAEQRTSSMSMLEFGVTNDVAMWLMLHYALRTIPFSVAERPTLQALLDRPELMAMYQRQMWGLWPVSNRRAGLDNDIAQMRRLDLPLKKVRVPTLVVHGTADELVPFETGLHTASQIPGAKFLRVEGGEHGLFMMNYEQVWPNVVDFVKQARKAAPKAPARPAARKPAARARKPAAPKAPARPVARKPAARAPKPAAPKAPARPAARKPAAPKPEKPAARRRSPRKPA